MHLRPSKVDCYSLSSSMGWVGFNFILMNINKLCHESYTGKKIEISWDLDNTGYVQNISILNFLD